MANKRVNQLEQANIEEQIQEQVIEQTQEEGEYLFPGGPTLKQIDDWKEKYGQIYMTEVDDEEVFIWRVLTRKEFKEIMGLENSDALYREERVCEKCILWPEGYTFDKISDGKAGVPTILAEQVMERSGFVPKTGPIAL